MMPAMRHFGLEEANGLVPLLIRTFEPLRPKVARLEQVMAGLEVVAAEGGESDGAMERERDRLFAEIRDGLQPLLDLGIEVKAADGLVDLRALRDGHTVYLCWKFPEPRVAFWHELEAGFAGRREIRDATEFQPTYLS